ncbi:hypothetical protein Tco_1263134 [Tanacetum coccineum]
MLHRGEGAARATSTNTVNTISTPISTASPSNVFSAGGPDLNNNDQDDSQIPALEDIYDNPNDGIFTNASYDDQGAVADFTNLKTTVNVSPITTSRIHSIHHTTQILGDPSSAVQTRSKDEEAADVDVHLYRSMIGSLMYLTAFRYLKGKPKLGLWYPRVSSFDLEAYSYSDYAGANLDRKSTIGGCQFLGRRLISWQCKKQTIVATSTTEVEYVAAGNCCGQLLWIQNQMLEYGFNFLNTKIYIYNEIPIVEIVLPI